MAPESLQRQSNGKTIADELRSTLRLLVWATVLLYLVFVGTIATLFWVNHSRIVDIEHSRVEAHTRLCAAEGVLIKSTRVQLARSKVFLRSHPNGIPGIPRSLLIASIRTQSQTIQSLEDPTCSTTPPAPSNDRGTTETTTTG